MHLLQKRSCQKGSSLSLSKNPIWSFRACRGIPSKTIYRRIHQSLTLKRNGTNTFYDGLNELSKRQLIQLVEIPLIGFVYFFSYYLWADIFYQASGWKGTPSIITMPKIKATSDMTETTSFVLMLLNVLTMPSMNNTTASTTVTSP